MAVSPLQPHSSSPAELQQRLTAERSGEPYLLFRDGDGRQRIFTLAAQDSRITIGRAPDCEVAIAWDASASRAHAQLEAIGGGWAIVDDGLSRHGTFVNGGRVRGRRRLGDGDSIRAGTTVLVFHAPSDDVQETAPPGEDAEEIQITPAQRRVLVELCRPYLDGEAGATPATNRQIAEALVLSVDAVKTHLRALCDSLGVEQLPRSAKRARLAQLALKDGLVSRRDI